MKGLENMDDWKRRLVEEYNQLKERYEKLRAFNNKREVERVLSVESDFPSQEDRIARKKECYRIDLLERQQHTMGEYLHILEIRAELEGIDLVTRI